MFEPSSALAVLGFAIGALGFVVSTISKVDEKIQDIRECEKRLRSFYWQLKDAHLKLATWRWIWIGRKPFPDATYEHFWGIEGFEEVQARANSILGLSREIRKLLRQPAIVETGQPLLPSELHEWGWLIKQIHEELPARHHAVHCKVDLVRKIGFTLFRNVSLSRKIDDLKIQIEGLREFTRITLRMEQEGDPNSEVKPEELRGISDLKAFFDGISTFGSQLYESQLQSPRFQWAIELGPPEAEYALDLWSEVDTTYVDFIVKDTALNVQSKASRVQMCVEEQSAHTNDSMLHIVRRIDDVVLGHGRLEHPAEYDRFFRLLEEPRRLSRPLRKMLTEGIFSGEQRKSFEMERADLVYGLGHWMVLLWNTPWSLGLCTCGIRCIDLTNSCTRHSFLPFRRTSHFNPECHPSKLEENKSELLGIALAEIALALPISVKPQQEDTIYLVDGKSTSRKRLLIMLRDRFGRNTITKAKYYKIFSKHVQTPSGNGLRGNMDLSRFYDRNED
ncbi:MAG: hypothetical protein Q9161_008705 [Pseudevernia consocians]